MFRCDRCKDDGELFEIRFPDGQVKEFILCEKHSGVLHKLRDAEYGTWKRGRRGPKIVNVEDLGGK